MSLFDDLERRARSHIDNLIAIYGRLPPPQGSGDMLAYELAKGVLAMLPVVRSADAVVDAQCDGEADICVETEFEHHEDCSVSKAEDDLYEAVVALHEAQP